MFRVFRRSPGWLVRFRHAVLTGDGHRYTVTGLAVIRSASALRQHLAQLPEGRA